MLLAYAGYMKCTMQRAETGSVGQQRLIQVTRRTTGLVIKSCTDKSGRAGRWIAPGNPSLQEPYLSYRRGCQGLVLGSRSHTAMQRKVAKAAQPTVGTALIAIQGYASNGPCLQCRHGGYSICVGRDLLGNYRYEATDRHQSSRDILPSCS